MKPKLSVFIIMVFLLALIAPAVQAQTETPTPPPLGAATGDYHFEFSDLYVNDITISGAFGVSGIYIPLPVYWKSSRDVHLRLDVVSSPLLKDVSNLTIVVNGQSIGSATLRGSTPSQVLEFDIPAQFVKHPGLSVAFKTYLRVTDNECEDTNIPGQWMRILNTSTIDLYPDSQPQTPNLKDMIGLIFSQSFDGRLDPVLFVLPDTVDEIVLSNAVRVASGLGHVVYNPNFKIDVMLASQALASKDALLDSNLILFGLAKDNPLIQQLAPQLTTLHADNLFYSPAGDVVAPTDGVVQIVQSPWNETRHILVISANDLVGLDKLGGFLADPPTMQSLRGSYEFISSTVPHQSSDSADIPWLTSQTTLKQLGYTSRTSRGTGVGSEYYQLYRSPGWRFDSGSQFVLKGTASPSINNGESYVAVFLNDTPLGTYSTSDFIRDQSLTFTIPANLDDKSFGLQMTMRVEYSNQLQQQQCTNFAADTAWVYIDETSYFKPNPHQLELPNLLAYPFPFSSSEPVKLVIEPSPQLHNIVGAVQLAFSLGYFTPLGLDIELKKVDTLQPADYDAHLIFLLQRSPKSDLTALFAGATPANGVEVTPTATPPVTSAETVKVFGQIVNELVPQVPLYKQSGEPFGVIYTDISPASPTHVAMVILSESSDGFMSAIDALTETLPPVQTNSTLVITQPKRPLQVLYQPEKFGLALASSNLIALDAGPSGGGVATTTTNLATAAPSSISVMLAVVPIVVSLLLLLIVWAFQRRATPRL